MFIAHLRQDAIDSTNGFLDWPLSLAEQYMPLAVIAVYGMIMLVAVVAMPVLKMIAGCSVARLCERRACVTPQSNA